MKAGNAHTDFVTGQFVISLDFELMWGVRDKRTIDNYGTNILGVRKAIPEMLRLFDKYGVKATFSTVGFLFAQNKTELLQYRPSRLPAYTEKKLSPYIAVDHIGNDEKEDPYHFGYSLLELIIKSGHHEVGTHTFSHYYCLEDGQTIEAFKEDMNAAKKIAAAKNSTIRSLVFPRNQFNQEYLSVCKEAGIDSYRGNPVSWLYEPRRKNDENHFRRAFRFIDAYINLTGYHCHTKGSAGTSYPVNIAASRFLRPYNKKLAFLDFLRLRRIKNAMRHAAKNKKLFHLWWHPHNFGVNLAENIHFLEDILLYYKRLHTKYGFHSSTMSGITDDLKKNHE